MTEAFLPVLLAGGLGARLAPHSTPEKPKAFLEYNGQSLLERTHARCAAFSVRPLVVAHIDHKALLAEVAADLLLESARYGTAFAIALSALYAKNAGVKKMLICPCDHDFADNGAFETAVQAALALDKDAVLFGVKPDHADTGLGYIHVGDGATGGAFDVKSFTEKPDQSTAERYIESDDYFWNAGVFLFAPYYILAQLKHWQPGLYEAASQAWGAREDIQEGFIIPSAPKVDFPHISIDYAILEKLAGLSMVEIKTRWRDLGTPGAFFTSA